jgi:ABC-type bacteriocin/lantibiotic exporter with double-glycine peptidase domain
MDEATSALDVETETKILQNIMNSQKHRTCILTTHRPSVLKISDRIYQVSQDRVEMINL